MHIYRISLFISRLLEIKMNKNIISRLLLFIKTFHVTQVQFKKNL